MTLFSKMQVEEYKSRLLNENKIVPLPLHWNQLFKMIQVKSGEQIAAPLILAAWDETSLVEKRERFHAHLNHAEMLGLWDKVFIYLEGLTDDDWLKVSNYNI